MNWNQLRYVLTIAEEKKHHPRGPETLPDPAVPFAEPEGAGRGAGHPAVHPRARRAGAHLRGQPVLRLGCGD